MGRTLHNIEGELPEEDTYEEEIVIEPSQEEGDTEGEVTLNAITCHSPPSTLKLTATVKEEEIQVLIDSGSTNSFIDPWVLQKLGIVAVRTYPLIVTVVNGNKTVTRDELSQFTWEMQNHKFTTDLRVLKLVECQMVHCVDWLRDLSPITLDFRGLTLQFTHIGEMVILQGVTNSASLQLIRVEFLDDFTNGWDFQAGYHS